MINLLPPKDLQNLQAAKTNRLLLQYNFLLLGVVGLFVVAFALVYAVLGISQQNAERTISENNQRVSAYAEVSKDATEFSKNLATARQIFANDTNYTDLLIKIAQTLPSGVILQSVTLDSTTLGKSTTLTASVKSPERALALKDALNQNKTLFSNAYLVSITSAGEGSGGYPYTATISVTFNKGPAQ